MSCPCDLPVYPVPLAIRPGLARIPRQIAEFGEFRRAMLRAIPQFSPLADWRARTGSDLGIMVVEFWAYIADVLALYDDAIAQESYLRTAQLRSSLRRLTGLLGYLPRPAVGSRVTLAVLADGRRSISLPSGIGFRSGAFKKEPPQVFESTAPATVHPLTNRWRVEAPVSRTLGGSSPSPATISSFVVAPLAQLKAGDQVFFRVTGNGSLNQLGVVSSLNPISGPGRRLAKLDLVNPVSFPGNTAVNQVSLSQPTQRASLWMLPTLTPDPSPIRPASGTTQLVLGGLYREIRIGDPVVLEVAGESRWFLVADTMEQMRLVTAAQTITINSQTVTTPAVSTPVTELRLDADIDAAARIPPGGSPNWGSVAPSLLTLHYGMAPAARLVEAPRPTLLPGDPIVAQAPVDIPVDGGSPSRFFLSDRDEQSQLIGGQFDFTTRVLTADPGSTWNPALNLPVDALGNLITATRGESVPGEVLGSGDASIPWQQFELQKKPLTYLPSPDSSAGSVASTLRIRVNGVQWTEVASFFGVRDTDEVYIVRQDDAGGTLVTFGDGVRGARLPTGQSNVVASYRFGAGAASPPAGSINQLAKPVAGLTAVRNPIAAAGGEDAESPKRIRTYAPRSALLLGRAVSLLDMEAAAAAVPGVRAARAEWRWHGRRQRATVQIWFIGPQSIAPDVTQALRGLSDPSTPIAVDVAQPWPTSLSLDLECDPRRKASDVCRAVRLRLLEEDAGMLVPEQVGIGLPLFRSRLFEAVLSTLGVSGVRSAVVDGLPFTDFAVAPPAGCYLDFETGPVLLNGDDGTNG